MRGILYGRRQFLGGAASAATLAGSTSAFGNQRLAVPAHPCDAAANCAPLWESVRAQYAAAERLVHLNSANLAIVPDAAMSVLDRVARDVSSDPSFENRAKFESANEGARSLLASMLRVSPDEIAVTRNASESNRTVMDGLDLGPDDEVVIWDQNHESNGLAWHNWARRRGFKVVTVSTTPSPGSPADLIAPFANAFNRRTKLVSFSHVSNVTGLALPAADICRLAASKNIMSLVDGAQTFGFLDLSLHRLGCDFFTASGHKWLTGPHETGILFVRSDRIGQLWPSIVTHGWEAAKDRGARKFENLGQRQEGKNHALASVISLRSSIGFERSEQRIRALLSRLRYGLSETGKIASFITPDRSELSAGILSAAIANIEPLELMSHVHKNYAISIMAAPLGDGRSMIRFSPNVYNNEDDIDQAIEAIRTLANT